MRHFTSLPLLLLISIHAAKAFHQTPHHITIRKWSSTISRTTTTSSPSSIKPPPPHPTTTTTTTTIQFSKNNNNEKNLQDDIYKSIERGSSSSYPKIDLNEITGNPDVDNLKVEVINANQRAFEAQKQVDILQTKIENAEAELRQKEDLVSRNESDRNAQKTRVLKEKESEASALTDATRRETQSRLEELSYQISQMKSSLGTAVETLGKQERTKKRLLGKLLKAEDDLEFEQMRFQKEKIEMFKRFAEEPTLAQTEKKKEMLDKVVREEMSKYRELDAQLESARRRFEIDRSSLERDIRETEQLREKKNEQMSSRYDQIKKGLMSLYEIAQYDAKQQEKRLKKKIAERDESIGSLQSEIGETKSSSEQLSRQIEDLATQRDEALKEQRKKEAEYSAKLKETDRLISDLTDDVADLRKEDSRYRQEIMALKYQFEEETTKRAKAETLFSNEQTSYKEQKQQLQNKVDDISQKLAAKTERLTNRYNEMREDMTKRLTVVKEEKRRLREKYASDIKKRDDMIARLEDEVKKQRNDSWGRIRDMDLTLTERNVVITGLRKDVNELSDNAKQLDDKVTQYKSSYRQILKASLRLTGKRLKNLVRRRKK